jgi:Flp pilus assembly protein CpaB
MLCVTVCVCLFLRHSVNKTQSEDTSTPNVVPIPPGKKVFTVPVSDKTIPDKSLLYPGCYVDVIAIYKLNNSKIPEAIPDFIVDILVKCKLIRKSQGSVSNTMLRHIQVLSIKRGVRGTFVNLIVDTKQAEGLSLAIENGSISLTVRKPFDEQEPKRLDKNRLRPLREINLIRGPTIQSTPSK